MDNNTNQLVDGLAVAALAATAIDTWTPFTSTTDLLVDWIDHTSIFDVTSPADIDIDVIAELIDYAEA
jgi:hypothetical protein